MPMEKMAKAIRTSIIVKPLVLFAFIKFMKLIINHFLTKFRLSQ